MEARGSERACARQQRGRWEGSVAIGGE